jgi:hypothetical protein
MFLLHHFNHSGSGLPHNVCFALWNDIQQAHLDRPERVVGRLSDPGLDQNNDCVTASCPLIVTCKIAGLITAFGQAC